MGKVHIAIILAIFILLTCTYLLHSTNGSKVYHIDNFIVTIVVNKDGSLTITEEIHYILIKGTFSRGFRYIPRIGFDDFILIEVSSPQVPVRNLRVSKEFENIWIKWEYPEVSSPGTLTFIIKYKVTNALRLPKPNVNSLDWNVLGEGWKVKIKHLKIIVVLPDDFTTSKEFKIEPKEDITNVEVKGGNTVITFERSLIPPHTPYRIVVYFPKIYTPYYTLARLCREAPVIVGLVSFTIVLAITLSVRFIATREPRIKLSITELNSVRSGIRPQSELSLLEIGTLLSKSFKPRYVLATIFDLANKGYFRIIDYGESLIMEPKRRDIRKLNEIERMIYERAKYVRDIKTFLESNFINDLSEKSFERLTKLGYLKVLNRLSSFSILFFIGSFILLMMLIMLSTLSANIYIPSSLSNLLDYLPIFISVAIGGIASSVILMVTATRKLTEKGVREKILWKEYLNCISRKYKELKLPIGAILAPLLLVYTPAKLKKILPERIPIYYIPWYYPYYYYTTPGSLETPMKPIDVQLSRFIEALSNTLKVSAPSTGPSTTPTGVGATGGGGGGGGGIA